MLKRIFNKAEIVAHSSKRGMKLGDVATDALLEPKQGSLLDLLEQQSPQNEKKVCGSFLTAIGNAERELQKEREAQLLREQTERMDLIQSELAATAELMANCKRAIQAPLNQQLDMMNERLLRLTEKDDDFNQDEYPSSEIEYLPETQNTEHDEVKPIKEVPEDFSPLAVEASPAKNADQDLQHSKKESSNLVSTLNLVIFCGLAGALFAALFALSSPDDVVIIAENARERLATDDFVTGSIPSSSGGMLASLLFDSMDWRKFVLMGAGVGILLGFLWAALFWLINGVVDAMGFGRAEDGENSRPSGDTYYTEWTSPEPSN